MTDTTDQTTSNKDKAPKKGFVARLTAGPKKIWNTVWEFSKELWNDHQFWVNAIAVKGGAAAILAGAAVGISFAFTFPFLVAAGIVLLCGAAIAVGTLGIMAGSSKIWDKLKDTWYKATGKERPPAPLVKKKTLLDKLHEKPVVQKILNHKWSKKFFASRTWQTMQKIKEKQDGFLGGLAVSSSVASTAVGIWILAVQVIALPVIAIPTLLTGAIVVGVGYLASSIVGVWLSTQNIMQRRRDKRAEQKLLKSQMAAVDELPAVDAALMPAQMPAALTPAFDAANSSEKQAELKTAEAKPAAPAREK